MSNSYHNPRWQGNRNRSQHQQYANHNQAYSQQQYSAHPPQWQSHNNDYYAYGQSRYQPPQQHTYTGYDQSSHHTPDSYYNQQNSGSSASYQPSHSQQWHYQSDAFPHMQTTANQYYENEWQYSQSNGRDSHVSQGYDSHRPPIPYTYPNTAPSNGHLPADSRGFHSSAHDRRYRGQPRSEDSGNAYRNQLPPAIRAAPRESYLLQAADEPALLSQEEAEGRKLLVVLDLNGTLVFRAKGGAGRAIDSKRPCPRPYLSCFLQYCLGTDSAPSEHLVPESQNPHGSQFWHKNEQGAVLQPVTNGQAEVVVWSSAQPKNVDSMITASFDENLRAKILRVWARDTLVAPRFFYGKAESVKDLEIIWSELNRWEHGKGSSKRLLADARDRQDHERPDDKQLRHGTVSAALESALEAAELGPWGHHNTVLVDDSPLKARLQPYNQLTIPEFGKDAASIMKRYIQQQGPQTLEEVKVSESEEDTRDPAAGLEPKETPDTLQQEVQKKPKKKPVTEARLDNVLLQTIGVLETLRYQRNVSAFIYAGGIKGYGAEQAINARGAELEQRIKQANTPEYWADMGRKACRKMGIQVKPWTPGLSTEFMGLQDNSDKQALPSDALHLEALHVDSSSPHQSS